MAIVTGWPKLQQAPSTRNRSLEDRGRALESACRAAMQLLEGNSERTKRLTRIDPVPASTRQILRRLARGHA